MADLLLGIDVGTSGAKAILLRADGDVAAVATSEYELLSPRPRWSEQRPDDWWTGTCASIRRVLDEAGVSGTDVAAVGLTGQMHGLVMLDRSGEVLRPAILWNDQRTAAQCGAIHERLGRDHVIRITGKPVLTGFTLPKILWVRQHEPYVFNGAAMMLLPKDYVRFCLTGEYATDCADASGTSLFDISKRAWSDEMLDAFDMNRETLPTVFESPEVCARISADGANATGLPEGTPVVAGAGDQAAEAIGCGIVDEGSISVTIGTSGVVFALTRQPTCDPEGQMHGYCHAIPGLWHVMGVMLSAGGSFQWYRDALCETERAEADVRGIDPYEVLTEQAATVEPGCEGLIFLPYLTGERTPHADPHARGVFFGLTRRHTKAHLTRAVMEGITFGLRDLLELARGLGLSADTVRVSGGGARSDVWKQILADVLHARVATVNVSQGAAYGAAILAGVGAGVYADVKHAANSTVHETSITEPNPDTASYDRNHKVYESLYNAVRDLYPALDRS